MKLTGSRCQCRGCDEYFNSTFAFEKHRRGKPDNRHCLTTEQMQDKGMERNAALFWVSQANTFDRDKTA
jgi:hypothetical protein